MATIEQRGIGQWRVLIRRKGPSGNSIFKTKTFETHAAAKQWANVTEGRISGEEYVDRSKERRASLKDLLERYEREISPSKKGHATEVFVLRAWASEEFARWPLPSIESVTIADWMAVREAAGKAPTTISNAVNLLSAVYKTAIAKWGFRVTNPCSGLPRPKQRPPRSARLTAEEQKRLLEQAALGPHWLVWCVRLALETAMRAGEIRRLRWEHIHNTHIHLPKTKTDVPRDVPLTDAALKVVQAMRRNIARRADGYVFGDPDSPNGFTKNALTQAFIDAAKRAKVSITFHDLRHVATTRLASLHDNVLELSATTGHKTLNILKRYYNPDPADRAMEIRMPRARESKAWTISTLINRFAHKLCPSIATFHRPSGVRVHVADCWTHIFGLQMLARAYRPALLFLREGSLAGRGKICVAGSGVRKHGIVPGPRGTPRQENDPGNARIA